jgi:hypothetical protein
MTFEFANSLACGDQVSSQRELAPEFMVVGLMAQRYESPPAVQQAGGVSMVDFST